MWVLLIMTTWKNLVLLADHLTMCVAIASDSIWIIAASILTAYDISEAIDIDGTKLTPESPLEFTNGIIRCVQNLRLLAHSYATTKALRLASRYRSSVEFLKVWFMKVFWTRNWQQMFNDLKLNCDDCAVMKISSYSYILTFKLIGLVFPPQR